MSLFPISDVRDGGSKLFITQYVELNSILLFDLFHAPIHI